MGEAKRRREVERLLETNEALQSLADPFARRMLDALKGQLLLVMVRRLGGEVRIPVSEVDDTGGLLLAMQIDGSDFVFSLQKKN